MYFFSDIDPNYRIKGSRDPLGFQSLWAAAGHRAVAHLSTVSSNLTDYMILSYALYFYRGRPENQFLQFFLKFEQVCGYARRIYDVDKGFNGIEFVNKRRENSEFSISLKPTDTLLSNQRTYGIYGKYIRPYRDMGAEKDPRFIEIMEQSLSKTDRVKVLAIVQRLLSETASIISKEELEPIANMLQSITPLEQEFYRTYILQVPQRHHAQNNLYEIVHQNQEIAQTQFNLHTTIEALKNVQGISEELTFALENISNTDRVLFPLNRCFTHLLSQSSWEPSQIPNDTFITNLPKALEYDFSDSTIRELNTILSLEPSKIVEAIVERNKKVSSDRKSKEWIIKEKDSFKVVYGENGQKQSNIDFANNYEFPYFLNTYLSLYKQIEL